MPSSTKLNPGSGMKTPASIVIHRLARDMYDSGFGSAWILGAQASMTLVGSQYRQGDVLLIAVNALPADVEPIAFAAEPLALVRAAPGPGSHLLAPSSSMRAFGHRGGDGSIEWLEVARGITLTHREHAPIILEPGIWRVVRQREYDPAAGHRRVVD
jgi:hypothetical protein